MNPLHQTFDDIALPPLDLDAIVHRGRKLRWRRRLLAGAAMFSVVGAFTLAGLTPWEVSRPHEANIAAPPTRHHINVYLQDDLTSKQRNRIIAVVETVEGLISVRYVDKWAAFEEFRDYYADDPEFWQDVPRNALPARLDVTLASSASVSDVRRALRDLAGVDGILVDRSGAPPPRIEGDPSSSR